MVTEGTKKGLSWNLFRLWMFTEGPAHLSLGVARYFLEQMSIGKM